jgi:hypothetical protein
VHRAQICCADSWLCKCPAQTVVIANRPCFEVREVMKQYWPFDVHGSVHLGNFYIYIFDCKSDEIQTDFLCILYYTTLHYTTLRIYYYSIYVVLAL